MTLNVGIADRLVRLVLGGALIYWAITFPNAQYSYLGWLGVVIIATSLVGWCGIYRLFDFSTMPEREN